MHSQVNTVLGTPTEGSQKRGTIGFAIVEPFTASDNGKLKKIAVRL